MEGAVSSIPWWVLSGSAGKVIRGEPSEKIMGLVGGAFFTTAGYFAAHLEKGPVVYAALPILAAGMFGLQLIIEKIFLRGKE
jgi:hypothetical protein